MDPGPFIDLLLGYRSPLISVKDDNQDYRYPIGELVFKLFVWFWYCHSHGYVSCRFGTQCEQPKFPPEFINGYFYYDDDGGNQCIGISDLVTSLGGFY